MYLTVCNWLYIIVSGLINSPLNPISFSCKVSIFDFASVESLYSTRVRIVFRGSGEDEQSICSCGTQLMSVEVIIAVQAQEAIIVISHAKPFVKSAGYFGGYRTASYPLWLTWALSVRGGHQCRTVPHGEILIKGKPEPPALSYLKPGWTWALSPSQECKIQNTVREYCKIFAAEARTKESFGPSLEWVWWQRQRCK